MNDQYNWYKSFFNGVTTDFWIKVATPEYTKAEINFIQETVSLPDNASILDVPCGFGRHSIELAHHGYHVTGIDISQEYIHSLKEIILTEQLPIQAVLTDILEYELPVNHFDLAICLGNSFGYFSTDKMVSFVRNVSQSLKQDGHFIINTGVIAESILPNFEANTWMEVDDTLFLMENIYHVDNSVLQTNMRFIRNGRTEARTAYHFVYTLAEIRRILAGAGFIMTHVYSGFGKEDYKFGNKQAYLIAIKAE